MGVLFSGLGLNLLTVFYFNHYITETPYASHSSLFMIILVIFWLISMIGGFLTMLNEQKMGTIFVIIGSIIFIPIGIVAILGATNNHREKNK